MITLILFSGWGYASPLFVPTLKCTSVDKNDVSKSIQFGKCSVTPPSENSKTIESDCVDIQLGDVYSGLVMVEKKDRSRAKYTNLDKNVEIYFRGVHPPRGNLPMYQIIDGQFKNESTNEVLKFSGEAFDCK